jgi:hypothetical protein
MGGDAKACGYGTRESNWRVEFLDEKFAEIVGC